MGKGDPMIFEAYIYRFQKHRSSDAERRKLKNPKNIPRNNWREAAAWVKPLVGFSINSQMLPRELFQELKFSLKLQAAVQVQMEDEINFGTLFPISSRSSSPLPK